MNLPDDLLNVRDRAAALGRYPVLTQVPAAILDAPFTFGMQWVKRSLINDIKAFEESHANASSDEVRSWVAATRQKYADWLARL